MPILQIITGSTIRAGTNTPCLLILDMKINTKKIVFVASVIASAVFNILLYSSIGSDLAMKIIWGSIGLSSVVFQAISIKAYFDTKELKHLVFYIVLTIVSMAGTVGTGWAQIEKTSPVAEKKEIDNDIKAINKAFETSKELSQWATIRLLKEKSKRRDEVTNISANEKKISSSLSGIADMFNAKNETVGFIFLMILSVILEMLVLGSALPDAKKEEKKKPKKNRVSKIAKEEKQGQLMMEIGEDSESETA